MADIHWDIDAFLKSLDATDFRVMKGAERGMYDAVDDLLAKSRDLAPLDKGTLRRSSFNEVKVNGTVVEGSVTYSVTETDGAGNRFNYALYMHEFGGKSKYKNPTTPGTKPKFLERPMKENTDRYMYMIAEEIRKELT